MGEVCAASGEVGCEDEGATSGGRSEERAQGCDGARVRRRFLRGGAGISTEAGGGQRTHSGIERLNILDLAMKSGLPLKEFAGLVGMSHNTLYLWKKRFDLYGVDGLVDQPRKSKRGESHVPEAVKKAILMIKGAHPEYGCERISDMLGRGPGLSASPSAVLRVIREAGFEVAARPVPAHGVEPKRFERARPNQLWQTDIFYFTLKRENRRLYMVVFLDDHSRYVVGYGVHASMGAVLVIETLRAAIGAYGAPEEVLTDNGPQYQTWRGKSRFSKELERLGIRHILARPRHPQTVGKAERFWGTLWRECVQRAVFLDVEDARKRVGHFIDHYNFQRPHQGIDGSVPADRFFGAQEKIKETLAKRVAENALVLARDGAPRKPFYLTGRVGDVDLSIHAEGERVVLCGSDGRREEVDLRVGGRRVAEGEQAEVLPEPLAVHGEVNESEIGNDERDEEAEDGSEEGAGGRDEEDNTGLEAGAVGRERRSEAEGGGGSGSTERGAGVERGGGGAGNLDDELLHAGGPGAAGDSEGARAASERTADALAGGCAQAGGTGEGEVQTGGGEIAGAVADGAQERASAGAAMDGGETEDARRPEGEEADEAGGEAFGETEARRGGSGA